LRVDIGAIVSKYIGETEKTLQQLFAVARDRGAILVIDEADALLARRDDVRDAHDRYANAEIGHLLRRIDGYEGLAIVTTNTSGQIGRDVVCRIDVIVDFPMPDEEARRALWERLLSTVTIDRGGEIDVARLAREHELTGAEILRCVRFAAMLAAGADSPLDDALLQSAAADRVAMRSTIS
jgi:SpoVK/Ycf46/Vps4 family AAA+-type ATPase